MTTPYRLELRLMGLPAMPNSLLGAPWKARSGEKRKWFNRIAYATRGMRPPRPLTRARVTLTRISSVEPDADGLRGSFKPILDALTVNMGRKRIGLHWVPIQRGLGILLDDHPRVIGEPVIRWEKGKAGEGSIVIVVEEIPVEAPANS
jgi:hypothetical protein